MTSKRNIAAISQDLEASIEAETDVATDVAEDFMEIQMTLSAGSRVFYPSQGPCLVDRVVKKAIGDKRIEFYHLIVLDDKGCELYIPVEKAGEVGIRQLLKKSEIPKLLNHLKKEIDVSSNWKERASNNSKRIQSGSAFDLARVIESLTLLSDKKKLSPAESQTLERARHLLAREISEVIGVTEETAERKIDLALESRNGNGKGH